MRRDYPELLGPCEWNPFTNLPATSPHGCPNEATVALGAKGEWHLCEQCAALPRFARYRVRKPLRVMQEGEVST